MPGILLRCSILVGLPVAFFDLPRLGLIGTCHTSQLLASTLHDADIAVSWQDWCAVSQVNLIVGRHCSLCILFQSRHRHGLSWYKQEGARGTLLYYKLRCTRWIAALYNPGYVTHSAYPLWTGADVCKRFVCKCSSAKRSSLHHVCSRSGTSETRLHGHTDSTDLVTQEECSCATIGQRLLLSCVEQLLLSCC